MTVLELRDLAVRIPRGAQTVHAVNGVSLSLEPGKILALVGESGSGKSMTARAVLGLCPMGSSVTGRVEYQGEDLLLAGYSRLREIRGAAIALAPQDPAAALSPFLTVAGHFAELVRAHPKRCGSAWRTLAFDALEAVGLSPASVLPRHPFELSGGQQQRVALGLSLALRPEVLLADEITTSLDVSTQRMLMERLVAWCRNTGAGALLITHDLAVAATWADAVVVMYGGRVTEIGPTRRVTEHPRHPYTFGLIASHPDPAGRTPLKALDGHARTLNAALVCCPFVDRCPASTDHCRSAPPPELDGGGHATACYHPRSNAG